MKILNKYTIPGTGGRYELHLIQYEHLEQYEVWSNNSNKYLKDTTSFNKFKGLNRTYSIKFTDEKDCVAKKIYLKDIIKLCEGSSEKN